MPCISCLHRARLQAAVHIKIAHNYMLLYYYLKKKKFKPKTQISNIALHWGEQTCNQQITHVAEIYLRPEFYLISFGVKIRFN